MSEQSIDIQEVLAGLSQEQRDELMRQYYVNQFAQNQNALTANQQLIANLPELPKPYAYQPPKNIGDVFKNIGRNLLLPAQQQLGLAPTIKGRVANMQYDQYQREIIADQNERLRDNMARNMLMSQGVSPQTALALQGEDLQEAISERRGPVKTDQFGNTFQENLSTGERTMVNQVPDDMVSYFLENPGAAQQLLGTTSTDVGASGSTVPSYTEFKRSQKFLDMSGEKSQEKMFGLSDLYEKNALGATDQLKRLQDMILLIANNNFDTGGGQELILGLQNLGFNFNFTDKDPTEAQLFDALATGFIIPAAKDLGVNPTDKDMELLGKAAPELSKTREGNLILLKGKQIEQQRAILVQDAFLQFQQDNFSDFQTNPAQFDLNWKLRLNQIIKSPEFSGPTVLELKAQAVSLLNKPLDIERVLDEM